MKEDRLQSYFALTAVGLLVLVLVVNYVGVIARLLKAANEAGIDPQAYIAEEGGDVLVGVGVSLPQGLNPLDLLRFSPVSFLLILLVGVAVVHVWRQAGAFDPGRPPLVIWLSGAVLPPLVGLAWIPVDFLLVVGPFMGLANPEGFGVLVGEALWNGIWGLELSGVLSLLFLIGRVSTRHSGRVT